MTTKRGNNKDAQPQTSAAFGFGGILDGLGKLMEAASKLKEAGGGVSQTGEFSVPGLGEKGKGIFGFSFRTMAGGDGPAVQVQPFGNVHKTKEGMTVEEDREPVVDVLEEGDLIRVIAELPGVSQRDIAYEVTGDVLTISTKGPRSYHAEVLLPSRPAPDGIESAYNNGVLELKLKKAPK